MLGQGAALTDHDVSAKTEPTKRFKAAYVHGSGTNINARLLLTLNPMEHR